MQHPVLLFLVIAIMHSPHEMNCVQIIHDGFEPNETNSRHCIRWVKPVSQMTLDEGETLENLPPYIICQAKCPYYEVDNRLHIMRSKNGSWTLYVAVPLQSCASPYDPLGIRYVIECSPITERTYQLKTFMGAFAMIKYCSIRLFLGEVEKINGRQIITNDHGLKGLSNELAMLGYEEAPYYHTAEEARCVKYFSRYKYTSKSSKNGASDRWPPTDFTVIICGVAMASAVLCF